MAQVIRSIPSCCAAFPLTGLADHDDFFTRIMVTCRFCAQFVRYTAKPPNQVLIRLALFLTFFIMKPVYTDVYQQAIEPFDRQEINQAEAFDRSEKRIKAFYDGTDTGKRHCLVCGKLMGDRKYHSSDDVPLTVMVPAFIISELRTAFSIGF